MKESNKDSFYTKSNSSSFIQQRKTEPFEAVDEEEDIRIEQPKEVISQEIKNMRSLHSKTT